MVPTDHVDNTRKISGSRFYRNPMVRVLGPSSEGPFRSPCSQASATALSAHRRRAPPQRPRGRSPRASWKVWGLVRARLWAAAYSKAVLFKVLGPGLQPLNCNYSISLKFQKLGDLQPAVTMKTTLRYRQQRSCHPHGQHKELPEIHLNKV